MLDQRKKEVLDTYQQSKSSGELSANLQFPTTAKLRNECARIFHDRPNDQIRSILQSFVRLGMDITNANDVLSIDADKFKPLLNFMNGDISNPNPQNVELLAWLTEKKGEGLPVVVAHHANWFTGNVVFVICLLLAASIFVYWQWNREKCMAWNGQAFEKVVCEEYILKGEQAVAIDASRLTNLKRITKPDTLTYWSISKVWYTKIDNMPEFYTHSGMHPVHKERALKPLTKHIIDRYILKKELADSLSSN